MAENRIKRKLPLNWTDILIMGGFFLITIPLNGFYPWLLVWFWYGVIYEAFLKRLTNSGRHIDWMYITIMLILSHVIVGYVLSFSSLYSVIDEHLGLPMNELRASIAISNAVSSWPPNE